MDNIRLKPAWTKSKEEIWNEMFENLDERVERAERAENLDGRIERAEQVERTEHPDDREQLVISRRLSARKGLLRRIPVWGYAASLLIPLLLICCFYTVTEETTRGEQATVRLPDRSTATMNAESKLSYKPFVWFFSRKVSLRGEAFFEVKQGSVFTVHSGGNNRVKVLGTTFNVYARSEAYRVACLTGRVQVQAGKESVVLHPNMQAVHNERQFAVNSDITPLTVTGWMQDMFVFIEAPVQEVIAEVERRYDIAVTTDCPTERLFYTGTFTKPEKPEVALEIIGKALDVTFRFE